MQTTQELDQSPVDKLKAFGKRHARFFGGLALTALALGGSYVVFADSEMDILGDYPSAIRSTEQMKAIADLRAANMLEHANESERFKLLFLQDKDAYGQNLSTINVTPAVGGNGILGLVGDIWHSSGYTRAYGQTCLVGSAFDIRPNSERDYDDRGSQATLTIDAAGIIVVYPANSPAPPLTFTETPDGLFHADETTETTLVANGCEAEIKI